MDTFAIPITYRDTDAVVATRELDRIANRPRGTSIGRRSLAAWLFVSILTIGGVSSVRAKSQPNADRSVNEVAGMYRLTEQQYRNSISDVFGADIAVGGRFDPIPRRSHGRLASGSYQIAVSAAGAEQYSQIARNIARQVVDDAHRALLVACQPRSKTRPDNLCAKTFFARVGPMLYRRPLSPAEIQEQVHLAAYAARATRDFYTGLALALEQMLVSPWFIFQVDRTEHIPGVAREMRLDAYAKAARLSFFLWNTTPDPELEAAAARNELQNPTGLAKQVDRLLSSPRLAQYIEGHDHLSAVRS
jgi:hypothetical protein